MTTLNLQQRIDLLEKLGQYMPGQDEAWQSVKDRAFRENNWFIPEFIDLAVRGIAREYLQKPALEALAAQYGVPDVQADPQKVGIVMAGNIPLVGFHDLLCVFLSGHIALVKPSTKDEHLIKHLVSRLTEWEPAVAEWIVVSEMIRNCDAYIATGSNNSSRYFDFYFQKYPSIIRKNRTSVAVLSGQESPEDLSRLADDVYRYFGLGCRNVTKLFVPEGYDFVPLLEAFRKYDYLANHHKYKNNYDYQLAMHILNNRYYMTNGSILLVEDPAPFSAIAQLHYEFYKDEQAVREALHNQESIQCVVGKDAIGFGGAQTPGICDYADGVDTMQFLMRLG
jgi:hypothetical protein